ncbi:MAG TPA: molecular chaperone DnaJ [bacterium]|nr:molecular chaperone DnaJ [bacterium]
MSIASWVELVNPKTFHNSQPITYTMNKRDYYQVLGLKKGATKQEIKKKYRTLAKEYHPDRNKAANAEEKFKEIQEAYEILNDDQKRQAYDQYGHAGTQGFGGGSGGYGGFNPNDFGNMNDIFSQFFGQGFGGFGFGQDAGRAGPARGNDLQLNLVLDFEEAVFGSDKTLNYKRKTQCKTCKGTGAKDPDKIDECPECKGRGRVTKVSQTFLGAIQTTSTCPTCNGEGSVAHEKCENCKGETTEETNEEFKIKVPQGIPDGVTLRFKDRGNSGKKGGEYGDLFVNIEVKPHERFERQGDDIYIDQEIGAIIATIGGNMEIPTVHGDVTLKIPSGTQPGKVLRLKGKGAPKFRGNGNGDQFVRLIVTIPEKISRKEKKLWEELSAQQ